MAYGEIQALIEDMQSRISNIDALNQDAGTALDALDDQVDAAIDKLSSRQDENVALRDRASGLTSELDSLAVTHLELSAALARAEDERSSTEERLQREINALAEQLALERGEMEALRTNLSDVGILLDDATAKRDDLDSELVVLNQSLAAERDEIAAKSLELASLQADVDTLRQVRRDVEGQVAAMAAELKLARESLLGEQNRAVDLSASLASRNDELLQARERLLAVTNELDLSRGALQSEKERNEALLQQLGQARDRSKSLEAKVADQTELTVLAQKDIEARDIRLQDVQTKLSATERIAGVERQAAAESRDRAQLLNSQLAELRNQLIKLIAAIETSEEKNLEQQAQIVNLGARLNQALATKVQELASYRSEFFGRLRQILGSRSDMQVVGDRFVVQSEVLFETGSSELGKEGQEQLDDLAKTLRDIAVSIPPGVDWILRVDGHTDERPIRTEQFPSNWELSAARALSVVNFLVEHDIPPSRLVAAGFGQFHPLDPRKDEIAFRRNRRIEFKLTQR